MLRSLEPRRESLICLERELRSPLAVSEFWHLRNCSLFLRLTDLQWAMLERSARVRVYPRNSAVYLPRDDDHSVFLLVSGRIRLCSITPDGKQAILAFVEPGELFGELALVHQNAREERAEAAVDATVVQLARTTLVSLMEQSPHLSLGVTKLIGLRRIRIERRLRSLLFRSSRDRLLQLLMDLADDYGQPHPLGVAIGISVSHQDLASIIGATRETVTHVLGELVHEGVLKVVRRRLIVQDMAWLRNEVAPSLKVPSAIATKDAEFSTKALRANSEKKSNRK